MGGLVRMNQVKTGAFIAKCRKGKGWTQALLAEKLGVTDKAVSKWETGRSMPDLALLVPLCGLLGISLNELFAGEWIPEGQWREKADAVLMEVVTNWLGGDKWEEKMEKGEAKKGKANKGKDGKPQMVLHVRGASKRYEAGNRAVAAVDDVSFQVERGSFVGIMGASGSGKTTLLNLIATIDKPTGGTIEINGEDVAVMPEEKAAKFRREHLGFVFQEYNLLETLTIYENIALALTIKEAPKENIGQTILDLAEKLDISSVLAKFPYEVSGGQRQRCACARAVAVNPDIILADEPTGALDSNSAKQLLDTFSMLRKEYGATILMVTHDVLSASYCDRILFMRDGRIRESLEREQKNKQEFFASILEKMACLED